MSVQILELYPEDKVLIQSLPDVPKSVVAKAHDNIKNLLTGKSVIETVSGYVEVTIIREK